MIFAHSSNLTCHQKIHTGDKQYQCTRCNKCFVQKSTHMDTHTGDKSYQCSHCNKAFAGGPDLTRRQLIHTRDKPYKCVHCNKYFAH